MITAARTLTQKIVITPIVYPCISQPTFKMFSVSLVSAPTLRRSGPHAPTAQRRWDEGSRSSGLPEPFEHLR